MTSLEACRMKQDAASQAKPAVSASVIVLAVGGRPGSSPALITPPATLELTMSHDCSLSRPISLFQCPRMQVTSSTSASPIQRPGSFRGRFRQFGALRLANLPRKVLSWHLELQWSLAADRYGWRCPGRTLDEIQTYR